MPKFCDQCATRINENAKFCHACSSSVTCNVDVNSSVPTFQQFLKSKGTERTVPNKVKKRKKVMLGPLKRHLFQLVLPKSQVMV